MEIIFGHKDKGEGFLTVKHSFGILTIFEFPAKRPTMMKLEDVIMKFPRKLFTLKGQPWPLERTCNG